MTRAITCILSLCVLLPLAGSQAALAPAPTSTAGPRFRKTVLDRLFRSEGVAVADVDRDGRTDVMAGNLWYHGGDWTPHQIRPANAFDPHQYSDSFINFASDINADGWPDQVVVGYPGQKAIWAENPGARVDPATAYWPEREIWHSACNESPLFADLLGTGKRVLVFPYDNSQMAWYEPAQDPRSLFRSHKVGGPRSPGTDKFAHGLGVGDVNGDKRPDIIVTQGYWEAPADPRGGQWKWTPANLGPACAHMHAYDVDADGDQDVISSSAHAIGIWWYEQKKGASGAPEFVQHLIDDSFSQSHALELADINRDGVMDLVTGKRWWAHGPTGDVQPNEPALLVWFELKRRGGKPQWTRHLIDSDSGVGTQFVVQDMNGDGRLDIATSNKKGVYYFEQR